MLIQSRVLWIAVLLFGASVGAVAAQVKDAGPDQPVEKPAERAYDPGHCYEYEIKMLLNAANTGNTLEQQQQFEIAARAYGELDALGQLC